MNFYNLSTPTYPLKFMWGKGDRGSLHSNEDVSPPLDIVMAVLHSSARGDWFGNLAAENIIIKSLGH